MSDETLRVACEKCGNSWPGAVPESHGWPETTGKIVEAAGADADGNPVDSEGNPINPQHIGAEVFRYVACADATEDQVRVYQDARREIARRAAGGGVERITAEGTEGHGKEQLEQ